MLVIKQYETVYADQVADLFTMTVRNISSRFYTSAQCQVWAPTPPNYQLWQRRLEKTQPILAFKDNILAGFIELEPNGYIDCFYVAPCFQRQSIGQYLFDELLMRAQELCISYLFVDASKVARPFFEKNKFSVLQENNIVRGEQNLINYSMERFL